MSKEPARHHVAYIHMPLDLWEKIKAAAKAESRSATNFIVLMLERLLLDKKK